MNGRLELVLFDLDGTISDSACGILTALRHAFAVNGLPPLDARTERALLGPPFYESLPPLVGADRLWPVIDAYRAHYGAGGMFDTAPYRGIEDVLAAAERAGIRMAIATSKPEHFAVPIVERLGLARYFTTIGGDEPAGTLPTKALVIDKVLGRLGPVNPNRVLMVGDREHDVYGAREHGIGCAGAGWGYGLPGELAAAGAEPICATPRDLLAVFGVDGLDAAAS